MNVKFFNRWSIEGVVVEDLGLKSYMSIEPQVLPKTGARYAKYRFHKSRISIVERLMNKVMIPGHRAKKHRASSGHMTGMAAQALGIVEKAFLIIEEKTKKNPIGVLVKAIENAAPREEIVAIEYGGARYPKAVECAPQRRIDLVLRYMSQGAYAKAFKSKKSIAPALADEILNAYQMKQDSNAIAKKLEIERQADASR